MDARLHDAYHKKSETVRWGKRRIVLDIPVDVFSSHQLDLGTNFLLKQMAAAGATWPSALDVGCGYGPIALFLASQRLSQRVLGIDRDVLAIAFAEWNARQNGLDGVSFEPGLAYDCVGGCKFDLVAANVPAKAGEGVHRLFLLGAQDLLTPDGEVWIVVVQPLEDAIDAILDHENVDLRDKASRRGHVVYRYAFRGPVPTPDRPYDRGLRTFRWKKSIRYDLRTWHGLPEFDTLSTDTELGFALLDGYLERERVQSVAVWNPGHGHIPVFLGQAVDRPFDLRIHARDALAIEATRGNLELNGFKGRIDARLSIDYAIGDDAFRPDLIIARLNSDLGDELAGGIVARSFADHPACTMILCGRAAFITRLEQRLSSQGGEVVRRLKRKGFIATRLCPK